MHATKNSNALSCVRNLRSNGLGLEGRNILALCEGYNHVPPPCPSFKKKSVTAGKAKEGNSVVVQVNFLVLAFPPSVELNISSHRRPKNHRPASTTTSSSSSSSAAAFFPLRFFLSPDPQNPQSKLIPSEPVKYPGICPLLFGVRFSPGESFLPFLSYLVSGSFWY